MKEIVFENVCKSYGKAKIIENLNLTIQPGERLILLGASGCGKSTTLRLIAGLEEISSGSLYMNGQLVNDVASGERNVSMVFQNYALYPHMTVADNIIYGLKIQKLPKEEIVQRLKSAVDMLELNGLEDRKPKDLSGGQRQRVALARAIVKRSDFLLLDEPLSNLDAQLRGHARKELVKIHQTYHQTFVYVTHDQVEAMTVGERIAVMHAGRLQMVDTPYNVYNRPANVFTAKFIGSPSTNIFTAHYADRSLQIGRQAVRLPEFWSAHLGKNGCREFYLGIRPEHIRLEQEKPDNMFAGTVKYVEEYGNRCGVYFDLEGHEVVAICERTECKPGDRVCFALEADKIHIFDKQSTKNIGYPEVYCEHFYQYQSV
ncbi:ABC transporter ATP-binding protein [Sporomusa acidovorans]|uniref:Oligosaccharides import ATP-binding protein MsmX n=1 Tax=Sporomusa acidovorans (strain ATCC 49682 / DSM 3132 / Mol) TaxID=1123286 RepID=A0ABZ3JAU5_SPOA4|nr:ABC transporter ATP-binding protein [Sporomusa acidovorans]OZC18599.1 trehalose import ATP-binding protein SugC [Sporomusa acidovorans DSM 3132]SDF52181.1 carbohydrate ABC transporter ATP-binding protein, CUT1 family [Sporomusa acidovorans]